VSVVKERRVWKWRKKSWGWEKRQWFNAFGSSLLTLLHLPQIHHYIL